MAQKNPADLTSLIERLAAADAAVVDRTVKELKARLGKLRPDEFRRTGEAICSLFYVDTSDRPDLEVAMERASDLLAAQGEKAVPLLLAQMQGSDIKSHLYLARTLGKIGKHAIRRLRDVLATAEDPYARAFALYAIGKMTCPEVLDAVPEVLGGLMHPDKEVRDSAARTLGKIARAVPKARVKTGMRREMFDALTRATRDAQAAVRAKAIRSLGKMAGAGLLTAEQRETVANAARAALGESAEYVWDSAFIVRQEAREALRAVESSG